MAKVVADTGCWTLQVVKRTNAHRFVVSPTLRVDRNNTFALRSRL
jgi:hypothetical protein